VKKRAAIIIFGLICVQVTLRTRALFAAQITQVGPGFTAQAVVSGEVVPIIIRHTPLQGVSPVTGEAIIQGEAGRSPNGNTEFPNRITPQNVRALDTGVQMRVTVSYRTMLPNGEQTEIKVLPPVIGPDPIAFAFKVDPADIVAGGNLEYQIKAERGEQKEDVFEIISKPQFFPIEAENNTEAFHPVGVQASAANVFSSAGGRLPVHNGNPNVGESFVDIPAGLLGEETRISLNEVPLNGGDVPGGLSQAVAVYRLDTDPPLPGAVRLSLLYPDFVFPQGQDGIIDGTDTQEKTATVMWWDGHSWRKLGGSVNAMLNTITVNAGNFKYLAIGAFANPSAEERRTMEKIITPNGDNVNDEAVFNLAGTGVKVDIYDVTGHRVRSLNEPNYAWNGKDDAGKSLESGVYIYQYQVEGKRVSGVIAIAK
jgi:gliding motility-associated-like protein